MQWYTPRGGEFQSMTSCGRYGVHVAHDVAGNETCRAFRLSTKTVPLLVGQDATLEGARQICERDAAITPTA